MFNLKLRVGQDPSEVVSLGLQLVAPTRAQLRDHIRVVMWERMPEGTDLSDEGPFRHVIEALAHSMEAPWKTLAAMLQVEKPKAEGIAWVVAEDEDGEYLKPVFGDSPEAAKP